MKKSKSSSNWIARQEKDIYVKNAKLNGYRSRAVYKLVEIQQKYKILNKGDIVVDLGAAPGGWSQIALEYVDRSGETHKETVYFKRSLLPFFGDWSRIYPPFEEDEEGNVKTKWINLIFSSQTCRTSSTWPNTRIILGSTLSTTSSCSRA